MRELRLLAREAAGEVDGGDGLVDRVGLHVLVEERGRRRSSSPAAAGRRVAADGIEEVISNSARWPTIAPRQRRCRPKQRHQVDRRERGAGDAVQVGAVGGVEAERAPSRRRTAARGCARARPPPYSSAWISTSAAFGAPRQARDRPGVRVGLLELVGRAVDRGTRGPGRACRRARCSARGTARRRRPRSRAGRRPSSRARCAARSGRRRRGRRASKRASSAARSASRAGSHSQRSSTPGRPR